MQVNATKDFKRSREKVLTKFRSPERIEEVLRRMSIESARIAEPPQPAWDCTIHWRDAPRSFRAVMTETVPHETIVLNITSDLATIVITCEFYDLPDDGCQVNATADITAKSMMMTMALQSMRLVKGKASERLKRMVTLIGQP
ncbi:hypothetical protein JI664_11485 [Rhodobacter sp. NTK016B]|uniref:hypothetical protein n=1 Tax=Rhodobacter sp. NTK016B TaxID=2759676 RepID=UPI001A8F5B29|nr:hypothetical protein [Rhodobacter sp. NTK016B]MBN8292585.1 hypothetical protein [Rhodobacter sp. NTK016B]